LIRLPFETHNTIFILNTREQHLLETEAGTSKPRLKLRTGTRVDVGLWWRKRPLWLCVLEDELLLFAIGRRRYCERIAIADCHQFHYNPSSGELVIEPPVAVRFPRLKMPTSDALTVLNLLKHNSTPNTTTL
jgi:hypothetical protein